MFILNKKSVISALVLHTVLCYGFITAKVLIITHTYNRPDFIKIQHDTFKKFLQDDYEFVVFDNADNEEMRAKMKFACNECSIRYIRIPQDIHVQPYLERREGDPFKINCPSARTSNCIQYSLDVMGFKHDDIVVIIDSDIFLVRAFSIRNYMNNCGFAAWSKASWYKDKQTNTNKLCHEVMYPWNNLVFLDMRSLPNKESIDFNCGPLYDCKEMSERLLVDSGGYNYYYLKNNPSAQTKFFDKIYLSSLVCIDCKSKQKPAPPCTHNKQTLKNRGLDSNQIALAQMMPLIEITKDRSIQFVLDGNFIHYSAGGNYDNLPAWYHTTKTEVLNKYFELILSC